MSSSLPTSTSTYWQILLFTSWHLVRPPWRAQGFPHELGEVSRKCREEPTAMEPPRAGVPEDGRPIEVPRLQPLGGLVRPIIEDHRRPHTLSKVAEDSRHVGTRH